MTKKVVRQCKRADCGNTFETYETRNKRYCRPECRWESEDLRLIMRDSLGIHRVSDVDEDLRTATCSVCGRTPVRRRTNGPGQLSTWRCRTGDRARVWARTYGLTVSDVYAMAASQNGRCAVCHRDIGDDFYIDHCHTTGVVRGLLCRGCNTAIGLFNDDPVVMRSAADYVARFRV